GKNVVERVRNFVQVNIWAESMNPNGTMSSSNSRNPSLGNPDGWYVVAGCKPATTYLTALRCTVTGMKRTTCAFLFGFFVFALLLFAQAQTPPAKATIA